MKHGTKMYIAQRGARGRSGRKRGARGTKTEGVAGAEQARLAGEDGDSRDGAESQAHVTCEATGSRDKCIVIHGYTT